MDMSADDVAECIIAGVEKQFGSRRQVFDRNKLVETVIPTDSGLFGYKLI
jgi:hypothetical protein